MQIQDTLTKNIKELKNDKTINWYMCGPTVYDHAHLGHARNYITNDILIRILNHLGYQVCLNMNITDIDDKIIKKAIETKDSWQNIAKQYEKLFIENMTELNVKMPDMLTRVSEYMPEIIDFIKVLISKNFAYKSDCSSSVYFDSENYYEKFTDGFDITGCCDDFEEEQKQEQDNLKNMIKQEKKNKRDFALWKAVKSSDEPYWESPWGNGRPGWHIECSAMSHSIFGDNLTIHSGGIDLKFPHHENERKQCVAMTENDRWVEIFVHIGHLHIDGLKMSKSLKNFITISNIIKKYDANVLRMFCLIHKYSDNIDYSEEHMEQVLQMVKQIEKYFSRTEQYIKDEKKKLSYAKPSNKEKETIFCVNNIKNEITNDLKNDFDTPTVMKKIFNLIHIANTHDTNFSISLNIFNYVQSIIFMFGLKFNKETQDNNFEFVTVIKNFREKIRDYAKNKKQSELFKLSDEIRDEMIQKFNINLIDK